MAKMFYTLEETAARLGVSEDEIKQMASDGKLQQFRDRDKLMFKRDQVDALAGGGESHAGQSGGPIPLADTDTIDILGDTDAANPMDATDALSNTGTSAGQGNNPNDATGISVFDADEVDQADPMAQTQITASNDIDDEELALESVGSGSGLLDLTRESDDTSLGVALDEIYAGGGEGSDVKMDSAVGSSGVFESALGMETAAGQTASSGLDNLAGEGATGFAPSSAPMATYGAEAHDPAGSAFGAGMLIGALAALVLGLIVVVSEIYGTQSPVTKMLAGGDAPNATTMWMYLGGLAVISIVLGLIGMAIGKKAAG